MSHKFNIPIELEDENKCNGCPLIFYDKNWYCAKYKLVLGLTIATGEFKRLNSCKEENDFIDEYPILNTNTE